MAFEATGPTKAEGRGPGVRYAEEYMGSSRQRSEGHSKEVPEPSRDAGLELVV